MTLADTATGPDWIIWFIAAIFLVLSIVLISGHGSGLIAGYNTTTTEEKEKYNEKKLCRVIGIGMSGITTILFFTGFFEERLPASFAYVLLGFIIIDVIVTIILSNTICRK